MEGRTRRFDAAPPTRLAQPDPAERTPSLWSIGGGKGGVGKSLVSSSLAVAFARRGHRCAIVDADLGSANLHSLLGMPKPKATLSHFLSRQVDDLSEVLCQTTIPNLWLLSDAGAPPNAANPKHAQKQRLIREIRKLDVDHVFLDLGAGCSYNVLDFFLAADHPLLVAAPEPTSIENTYHFLKAAFFRWLGCVAKQSDVRESIDQVLRQNAGRTLGSPRDLVAAVSTIDPLAGLALAQRAQAFAPQLIVNKVRNATQRAVGRKIADTCRDYLGAQVEFCGSVERDDVVYDAVSHCRPVLEIAPNGAFSRDVQAIAKRLIEDNGLAADPRTSPMEPSAPACVEVQPQRCLATHGLLDHESPPPDSAAASPSQALAAAVTNPERPLLPPLGDARPGTYLRRCRKLLGLEVHELSQATRIFSLRNIEDECYDKLPPSPYLRGLVLQYAQALGISEAENLADAFLERCQQRAVVAA